MRTRRREARRWPHARIALAILIALALLPPLLAPPSVAALAVDGPIGADMTWTRANSPYDLTGLVQVQPGVTLTIEPGVVVRAAANARLDVRGVLRAIGTADAPILFTAVTPTPKAWQGIHLEGTEAAPARGTLEYVTIEYGGYFTEGANLYLRDAEATVAHSTFRYGGANGIFGHSRGVAHLADSVFVGNASHAAWFLDAVDPALARLTATGNGSDVVRIGGSGGIRGAQDWEDSGLPYLVDGASVLAGATLTIEPGAEVRLGQGRALAVAGELRALGAPERPIRFTGAQPTAGSWSGIQFGGTAALPARGTLRHAIVEYGGFFSDGANVYLTGAQVSIDRSVIRYGGTNGVTVWSSATATIEGSQIVGNAGLGVYNADPRRVVLAMNNWWGAATGPRAAGDCNAPGTGQRISAGVAFRPFLTEPGADPGPAPPGETRLVSLAPARWFAPADGVTRVVVRITVRDGNGNPLPGRQTLLTSSRGMVVDGGLTDVKGEALAYVTATAPGDATLTARLETPNACEFARSADAMVTFTPFAEGDDLLPDSAAPYAADRLGFAALPLAQGQPNVVTAALTNPNPFPIRVNATFALATFGIGQTFAPIGEVQGRVVPANGAATLAIPWTPTVAGHYCIQLAYAAERADGQAPVAATPRLKQWNVDVEPAGTKSPVEMDALDKAQLYSGRLSHAVDAYTFVNDPLGALGDKVYLYIPSKGLEYNLDFIYANGRNISNALQGKEYTPGLIMPEFNPSPFALGLPAASAATLPPCTSYQALAVVQPLSAPQAQPSPGISPARAAAVNAAIAAGLEMTAQGRALVNADYRYGCATKAADLAWASRHLDAYLTHKAAYARAAGAFADALAALLQVMQAEGQPDTTFTVAAMQAYQAHLQAQGFGPEALAAAKIAGMTDVEIAAELQRRLAQDPSVGAGSLYQHLAQAIAAYRALAAALILPTNFGFRTYGQAGSVAATGAPPNNLARVYETARSFTVANPTGATATIALRPRRLDLPADWLVTVAPASVTLAPGAATTATVTITAAGAAVQGTTLRVAVEGYLGGDLLGGVVVDILVPRDFTPGRIRQLAIATSGPGQVSPGAGAFQAGSTATLTATPDPGAVFTGWALDGAPAGWANPLTLTVDTDRAVVATFAPAPTFADVPPTDPAAGAIANLAAREVIYGCDKEAVPPLFCPDDPTLRHQMAALISRAMPGWADETGVPSFTDNTNDTELMTRVATLQRHNVVRGYQDSVCVAQGKVPPCYGPLDNVTYGQVILFIARAMVEKGYWQYQPDDRTIFPDQNGAVGADPNTDQQTKDHRMVVTYVHYVGAPPDVPDAHASFRVETAQGPRGWADAAPRAWFARAFWPALDSYFGTDQPGYGGYLP